MKKALMNCKLRQKARVNLKVNLRGKELNLRNVKLQEVNNNSKNNNNLNQ